MKAREVDSFWLLGEAVNAYKAEYRDLSDTWRQIETKAQGSGSIAGIFVAAAFAWARDLPAQFMPWQRVVLCAGIGLLIVAVAFSLAGLRIRRVAPPPVGESIREMVKDLLRNMKENERKKRAMAFLNDQMTLWSNSNQEMLTANNGKANWVAVSQCALLAAIVCIAIVTLTAVI